MTTPTPEKDYGPTVLHARAALAIGLAGLAALAGAVAASAQVSLGVNNVIQVSSKPQSTDWVENCDSLREVLEGIADPTNEDRWVVRLEPGFYLCLSTLLVPPFVTLQGWGNHSTIIHGAVDNAFLGVVHLTNGAELRGLTVRNVLGEADHGGMAVSAWRLGSHVGDITLRDVTLSGAAQGPQPWAVFVDTGRLLVRDSVLEGIVRLDGDSIGWFWYSEIEEISLSPESQKRCNFVITPLGDLDAGCP